MRGCVRRNFISHGDICLRLRQLLLLLIMIMCAQVKFMRYPDRRARAAAICGLRALIQNGYQLREHMYGSAVDALSDDCQEVSHCFVASSSLLTCFVSNSQVRHEALQLLLLLSVTFGHEMQSTSQGHTRRLLDDVWASICNAAVMDIVVPIRVRACQLLSELEGVGEEYLVQAFSKKPLSVRDAVTDQGYVHPTEQRNQGYKRRKVNHDAGADAVIDASNSAELMDSGSLGAFVHGLEDEFSEVILPQ